MISGFGFSGTRVVPPPVSEPVKAYGPGSPEKEELKARLKSMAPERPAPRAPTTKQGRSSTWSTGSAPGRSRKPSTPRATTVALSWPRSERKGKIFVFNSQMIYHRLPFSNPQDMQ